MKLDGTVGEIIRKSHESQISDPKSETFTNHFRLYSERRMSPNDRSYELSPPEGMGSAALVLFCRAPKLYYDVALNLGTPDNKLISRHNIGHYYLEEDGIPAPDSASAVTSFEALADKFLDASDDVKQDLPQSIQNLINLVFEEAGVQPSDFQDESAPSEGFSVISIQDLNR